ncbi:NUDIX domain-containing protein [Aquibium sp. ELW1220]|uniref:NUDIX domain-containing protein n=1 Tax=Aquibium sp. ELW1220 TaxID=2976766 RepID=UPI0025B20061|nr:NUDIX domain-containing protein [Aquibium sp. ELW1220]MDN2581328.1 NUDIX domain-containing protein [Aquibium sp. ELW1220]
MNDPVRLVSEELLSDNWGVLTKHVFDYRRRDGAWERQTREVYDRGHGAAILPHDPARGTVLLVRQFRLPAFLTGHRDPLLEVCAGLLDADDPETCIRKEAEEELGYRLDRVTLAFSPYMSPGSVSERLWCFTAQYSPTDRISAGGGAASEGEDIEVVELSLEDAFAAVGDGRIIDAKTIMLLQHLMLAAAAPGRAAPPVPAA